MGGALLDRRAQHLGRVAQVRAAQRGAVGAAQLKCERLDVHSEAEEQAQPRLREHEAPRLQRRAREREHAEK